VHGRVAVTFNVPSERMRGLEVEAVLMPADGLTIGGSLNYTSATFTNGRISLFGNAYSYGPVGDTPEWSGVGYAELALPTAVDTGDLTPRTRLPGYALVNARLIWANILGTEVTGALFAKNLFDKAYFAGGMTLASALGHNAAAVGEPRTYGLELSVKF